VLTKSKLMSWRQCPKRLWLEANAPPTPSSPSERLRRGQTIGALARSLMGAADSETLDRGSLSASDARGRTTELLALGRTVFEGAFGDTDLTAYADVARPRSGGWELVEVKDSGSIKPHHVADAAIQAAAAARAGAAASRVTIAHLDTGWTYPGAGDYRGIFREVDVTDEAERIGAEVDLWIAGAKATLASEVTPKLGTGRHCAEPFPCPFHGACSASEPKVERPIAWLPGPMRKAARALVDGGARSMDELPDAALSPLQLRVKAQTRLGVERLDQADAAADLAACAYPLHFLDFETANPAIPIWAGTRPYAQTPFQFSLHILPASGAMAHRELLVTSGEDPSRPFAEALIRDLGQAGAIVVYNATFERGRIQDLAARFPDLAKPLDALMARIFDLQPVAKRRYYHPDQQGSWSIKQVLPCLVPDLRYDALQGVQDGAMAIEAYLELIDPSCRPERKAALEAQLRQYCRLDTLAMVAIWARFTGADDLLRTVIAAAQA
jgi:hypothetical protein